MQKEKKDNPICCYCGIREATTRDHVPPKSIFNKPRPSDLITVPCCFECNNEASVNDERYKAYLGMHVARQGGEAEKLFKDGAMPTLSHNKRIRETVLEKMFPVLTKTKSGIITGKGMAVPWDNEAHAETTERITRGLFYHHYRSIIPLAVKIHTYWFKELPLFEAGSMYSNSIANGNFIYYYNKVEELEYDSVWLFSFYGAHFSGGIILTEKV